MLSSECNFSSMLMRRKARTQRRSRVELGLGLGGLELKLHEEENKYIEAKLKFNSALPH